MMTDHTARRQRTIPARIGRGLRSLNLWRLLAWLRLEDVNWPAWLRFAVVVVSLTLVLDGRGGWGIWLLLARLVVRR